MKPMHVALVGALVLVAYVAARRSAAAITGAAAVVMAVTTVVTVAVGCSDSVADSGDTRTRTKPFSSTSTMTMTMSWRSRERGEAAPTGHPDLVRVRRRDRRRHALLRDRAEGVVSDYPNAPTKGDKESEIDFVLRESAYDDGRFGKPYGTNMKSLGPGVDIGQASADNASLQARIDAFKAGAADRHAARVALLKRWGVVAGTVAAFGFSVIALRRALR